MRSNRTYAAFYVLGTGTAHEYSKCLPAQMLYWVASEMAKFPCKRLEIYISITSLTMSQQWLPTVRVVDTLANLPSSCLRYETVSARRTSLPSIPHQPTIPSAPRESRRRRRSSPDFRPRRRNYFGIILCQRRRRRRLRL